jgi:hypothetical protein
MLVTPLGAPLLRLNIASLPLSVEVVLVPIVLLPLPGGYCLFLTPKRDNKRFEGGRERTSAAMVAGRSGGRGKC